MEYPITLTEAEGNPATCRVCLEHTATIPIFDVKDSPDSDVYTKLCQCLGERIEDEQGFPRHICELCLASLNTAVRFINQYKQSDKTLRHHKENIDLKNEMNNSNDIDIKEEHLDLEGNSNDNYLEDLKDNQVTVDKKTTVPKAKTLRKRTTNKTACEDGELSDDNIALCNIKKIKKSKSDQNSDSSDEDRSATPEFVIDEANDILDSLLPAISKERYIKAYNDFNKWRCESNIKAISEKVLIAYFNYLSKTMKPNSLWCIYSMLKTTMTRKNDVLISEFYNLKAFLRRLSSGYKPEKSQAFTAQDIGTFLRDAPDEIYLATKVALIIGISGACRAKELVNMTTGDIETTKDFIVVSIKTIVKRSFVVRDFVEIIKKYQEMRPLNCKLERFFLSVRLGRCQNQVMGKNKISGVPKDVAMYLNLPNAELFTGHSFKKTPASVLADAFNMTSINQLDGRKEGQFAEIYIEEPIHVKNETTP